MRRFTTSLRLLLSILFATLGITALCGQTKTSREVTLSQAGTLRSTLGADYMAIESLTVRRPLNGNDIVVLKEMTTEAVPKQGIEGGSLKKLNLRDAKIVKGGNPYGISQETSKDLYTEDNAISDEMFDGAATLEEIVLPKDVTRIGVFAFGGTPKLSTVQFPDGVTSIEQSAFYMAGLEGKLVLPQSLRSIGKQAFAYTHISDIVFPTGLKEIGMMAFLSNPELTKVVIPEGVETIGGAAFWRCNAIEKVQFPSTLKSIGAMAFKDIALCKEMIIYASVPPTCQENTFSGMQVSKLLLRVPKGSKVAYENATGFGDFANIVELDNDNPTPIDNALVFKHSNRTDTKVSLLIKGKGTITIDGAKEPFKSGWNEYTLTKGTVIIKGEITHFECSEGNITSLDLRGCKSLQSLDVNTNAISFIDLSSNSLLKELSIFSNPITSLDLSGCTNLEVLDAANCKLEALSVAKNKNLRQILIRKNNFNRASFQALVASLPIRPFNAKGTLVPLGTGTSPEHELTLCSKNDVANADIRGWTVYDYVNGNYEPYKGYDANGNPTVGEGLITLRVPESCVNNGTKIGIEVPDDAIGVALEGVDSEYRSFYNEYEIVNSEIRIKGDIRKIAIYATELDDADFSGCATLTDIKCPNGKLKHVNITGLKHLNYAAFQMNELESIDASNLPSLEFLHIFQNKLTSVKVDNSPKLKFLAVNTNKLTNEACRKMFETLPTYSPDDKATLFLVDTRYSVKEGNKCSKENVKFITKKGWQVRDYCDGKEGKSGIEYGGGDLATYSVDNHNVLVYPNPVHNTLYVQGVNQSTLIKLYTASGELVDTLNKKTALRNGDTISYDISSLPKGNYLLAIDNTLKAIVVK